MASPAEVFDALRQAHAKADAEAAAALYAPDAVYYEPDNVPTGAGTRSALIWPRCTRSGGRSS